MAIVALLSLVGTASASPRKKHKHQAQPQAQSQPQTLHARATVTAVDNEPNAPAVVQTDPAPPPTGTVAPPSPALDLKPPPPAVEYERPPRRWGLFGGGVALWAVAYAADAGVTYGFHHEPAGVALIPLVGPLIQCGDKYGYQGPMPMTGNAALDKQMADQIAAANTLIQTVTYLGLALDFAGQLTGITLALVGALTHHHAATSSSPVRVAATGHGLAIHF